ncbi:MAG: hypothetical protein ABIH41_00530, partial [Nanoarchaeota archaeon]
YEDYSYYPYFRLYSQTNLLSAEYTFRDFIHSNTDSLPIAPSEYATYLSAYIDKYHVKYIMFERGETPLEEMADSVGMTLLYGSPAVRIYVVE